MITFQYFDGCPNAHQTLDNLKHLVLSGDISQNDIDIVKINSIDEAEEKKFQGSPSILVNGIDIYTGKKPITHQYSCRVYTFDGIQTGVIPIDFMRRKILMLLHRQ